MTLIGAAGTPTQINVLHRPDAKCANVTFDYSENLTCTEWLMDNSDSDKIIQNPGDENNLGAIVKQFLKD